MNDFRVLLIYSGSSIHRKINCQSKRPTCMFRAEKARNSKVSSFMLGIWGYTTCRLSSAIRSSKGSNHPIKRSNINNQNFYFISEQSAVQFLNGPHSLRSLIAGRKLPYHCKNPMNSWSNNHWKCSSEHPQLWIKPSDMSSNVRIFLKKNSLSHWYVCTSLVCQGQVQCITIRARGKCSRKIQMGIN